MYGFRSLILNLQKDSRKITICVVYLSLLLDNVLLTMVVPMMPDFLLHSEENQGQLSIESNNQEYQNSYRDLILSENQQNTSHAQDFTFDLNSENGKVGLLLSSKAVVQLFLNPLIGVVTTRVGYCLPLFLGTCILLISATVFAFGRGYLTLFLARSLQGVASSCIGITGIYEESIVPVFLEPLVFINFQIACTCMCLVAEKYPNEPDRSKMMGFVLGSVAVGVLIGYPFGGFTYDYLGKSPPFLIVVLFVSLSGVLQLYFSDLKPAKEKNFPSIGWFRLLSDKKILLTGGAIGISTSTIAILEPCLPIWLLKEIKPKKWELGTAFIPDSLGYVIGTNSVGVIAYKVGRSKIALPAMILVGLSAFMVPTAKTMLQLVFPHFFLGFGIGAVDAALVPLLAALVDIKYSAHYGTVYAMQQMTVSLAYFLGPVFGSEIARIIGFPWLMRAVGLINILYSFFLLLLKRLINEDQSACKQGRVDYHKSDNFSYEEFSESEDSG